MTAQIGVQLYAVRGPYAADPVAALEKIAAIGIAGVEAAGLGDVGLVQSERLAAAKQLRERTAALGLQVIGVHSTLPEPEDADWLFEEIVEAGSPIALASTPERVLGFTRDTFESSERLARLAERLNLLLPKAAAHGLRVGYHNHSWEWFDLDGTPAYDRFVAELDPAVVLELDLYWAQTAGQDIAAIVERYGDRFELVHVKDGPGVRDLPQVAAGAGDIRLDEALTAGGDSIAWHILEVDSIAADADIWDVIGDSYSWLTRR